MKKLLCLVLALGIIGIMGCRNPKPVMAEEVNLPSLLQKLPALNQSVIFSLDENKFDYASSVTLIQLWNKKISIDLGYSPSVEALGLVSVKLINIKDYITFPVLNLITIEPFVYFGTKRIENLKELGQFTKGIGVKLMSLKF